jgi:hypothetical protein
MVDWTLVYDKMEDARGIAFDTCHKIYVLMDDAQIAKMREYGYDPLITKDEMSAGEMYETLKTWYEDSCGLRFIEAVSTVEGDPNEGFETLIGQGDDYEEEDEEDEE